MYILHINVGYPNIKFLTPALYITYTLILAIEADSCMWLPKLHFFAEFGAQVSEYYFAKA